MESRLVARATAAAIRLAGELSLPVDDTAVIQNSNKLSLRLLPCDAFARIALLGQEVAALEVRVTRALAALAAPTAVLDARVEPRVYEHDGFAITFWTCYRSVRGRCPPREYATALHRLHAAMRTVAIEVPHFTHRVADAERLLTHHDDTPALTAEDRLVLLDSLRDARAAIHNHHAAEQLLHGEPHSGNLLRTSSGPLFVDFETCCRGPVAFDVAHAPDDVSLDYQDVDPVLLQQCRRLVLAMVAAWRWDARDEFPNGRRHGRQIIRLLRAGPPWPALGELVSSPAG